MEEYYIDFGVTRQFLLSQFLIKMGSFINNLTTLKGMVYIIESFLNFRFILKAKWLG